MTADEVHEELIVWLNRIMEITVIKDRQSEERPALPYCVVDLANFGDLHQHVRDIEYVELDTEVPGTDPVKLQIEARPEIEQEWVFLVQVYGPGCFDKLRRVAAAAHVSQAAELPHPLMVHDVSQINAIPEYLGEHWEKRAQTNITLRGTSSDGFVVDVIEDYTITHTGERA